MAKKSMTASRKVAEKGYGIFGSGPGKPSGRGSIISQGAILV